MRRQRLWLLWIILLLIGCSAPTPITPTVTPMPTPTVTPLPSDTGWQPVGIFEVRSLNVALPPGTERVTVARFDPAAAQVRVLYTPGEARPVSAWAAATGAPLVINAGYFTPEYYATGLLVSEGERYGVAYGDFAGMLAMTPGGDASVRWLREWPYDPAEPLRDAVQSFPILVKPGGVMGFPADAGEGRIARRTVVAQDTAGRLLLLVAPRGFFTLHTLAVWLTESDLDIDIALNLDGGQSSGLWLPGASPPVQIDSRLAVPSVITVQP